MDIGYGYIGWCRGQCIKLSENFGELSGFPLFIQIGKLSKKLENFRNYPTKKIHVLQKKKCILVHQMKQMAFSLKIFSITKYCTWYFKLSPKSKSFKIKLQTLRILESYCFPLSRKIGNFPWKAIRHTLASCL